MASDRIIIRGAREHNLRNIDLEIPRDQLVVISGLSGSGKMYTQLWDKRQKEGISSFSLFSRLAHEHWLSVLVT